MTRAPILLLCCAGLVAPAATAQEAGAALFGRYCATCHGPGARGDGPTSGIISVAPTDLTRLSAAHDGTFPFDRIVRRIDGRDMVLAHGSPMPIYGAFFEDAEKVTVERPDGAVVVSPPVAAIALYLETLQAPG